MLEARVRIPVPLHTAFHDEPFGGKSRPASPCAFERLFSCLTADEPLLRETAYRLRYQVYCIENEFETSAANPGGLEIDEYDAQAPHKLLVHRGSGLIAGVVRLILPEPSPAGRRLPFYGLVQAAPSEIESLLPHDATAEVSRFAISRQFRRCLRELNADHTSLGGADMLRHASIGLMRGIVEMAAANGVSHLCAVMEPALLRLLARLGVHFDPLGPTVEHHGTRQPCFADLDALLARTWEERREVWQVLTGDGRVWPLGHSSVAAVSAA